MSYLIKFLRIGYFEKLSFFALAILNFFFKIFFFLLHLHENQSKLLEYQGWVKILMITLVYSKRVRVSNLGQLAKHLQCKLQKCQWNPNLFHRQGRWKFCSFTTIFPGENLSKKNPATVTNGKSPPSLQIANVCQLQGARDLRNADVLGLHHEFWKSQVWRKNKES